LRRDLSRFSDHRLVEACGRGDLEAFGELVQRYKDPVVTFVYRYLGDFDRAEDIAQETFMRVLRGASSYRREAKFSTWLYTIAANLARDELRRLARRATGSLQEMHDEPGIYIDNLASDSLSPVEELQRKETRDLVNRCLQMLPEPEREVLIMKDLLDSSYEEIAEAIDIPMGTVKSRLNRARRAFKDAWVRMHSKEVL
jgi:RNA polymerase sigma-70 factor (ECF subfamily)